MIMFFYDSFSEIVLFLFPGMIMGAIYDIFRMFRLCRHDSKTTVFHRVGVHFGLHKKEKSASERREVLIIALEDIFFCFLCCLIENIAFYAITDGKIRIYGLILTGLGFCLYYHTVGNLLFSLMKKGIRPIKTGISYVICMVLTPFVMIFKKIRILFQKKGWFRRNDKKKTGR